MPRELKISVGQFSDKGRKETNQDFHGILIPGEPLRSTKGIAVVLADGISSSEVGHIASESAVRSFLTDYYCTPESWSVKTSAQRVLSAINGWLHAQSSRGAIEDKDRGYVCTLTAIVLKAATAHLFHIGDARIYRVSGGSLEQLTTDHRLRMSSQEIYLSRALGSNPEVEIDYQALRIEPGDAFLLATDGVYEHAGARFMARTIRDSADLEEAAKLIVEEAYRRDSQDNLTVQIVRIDEVPDDERIEMLEGLSALPLPPLLDARMVFDGFEIIRELHASSRSHIYLARDRDSDELVALKIPSIDLRDNADYLRRFMMEDWIARRLDSPHVLKPWPQRRKRSHLYVAMEFIEGKTLTQWMIDNPKPDLDTVRGIVEQIARGLRAFHRMEMLHQDLRPDNVMIDRTGTARIIDFGSTRVAGVAEAADWIGANEVLGTLQYTAPEYFLGEGGTPGSDLFSLGVIAYQMLTGQLPYGAQVARLRSRAQLGRLRYQSALAADREIPAWIDGALQRAVHPDPAKRYDELSEFTFDLRRPNERYLSAARAPLLERNPVVFWQAVSLILACAVIGLLVLLHRQ